MTMGSAGAGEGGGGEMGGGVETTRPSPLTRRPAGQTGQQGEAGEGAGQAGGARPRKPGADSSNAPGLLEQRDGPKKLSRPDYIDERFWDEKTSTVRMKDMAQSLKETRTKLSMRTDDLRKADEADRAKMVPKTAKEYQVGLPPRYLEALKEHGIQLDPNTAFDKADEDLDIAMLRNIAFENKLHPEQFHGMLAHLHHVRQLKKPNVKQELARLGENARERVSGVQRFLVGKLGEDGANQLIRGAGGPTARFVELIERLMPNDRAPQLGNAGGSVGQALTRDEITAKMRSKAYQDPSHPQHRSIHAEVKQDWQNLVGNQGHQSKRILRSA